MGWGGVACWGESGERPPGRAHQAHSVRKSKCARPSEGFQEQGHQTGQEGRTEPARERCVSDTSRSLEGTISLNPAVSLNTSSLQPSPSRTSGQGLPQGLWLGQQPGSDQHIKNPPKMIRIWISHDIPPHLLLQVTLNLKMSTLLC